MKHLTRRFAKRHVDRNQLLFIESLEDRVLLNAAVITDLADYAPGATAFISASGYQAGEVVQFEVDHLAAGDDGVFGTADDVIDETGGSGHDSWQVTDGGAGDLDGLADGNISTSWYVNPDDSLGATFLLTASGLTSGETATHTFTDGAQPAPSTPVLDPGSDTGAPGDNITSDTTPTFNGTVALPSSPGSHDGDAVTVTLFEDLDSDGLVDVGESRGSTVVGPGIGGATVDWTITSSTLAAGPHTFKAYAQHATGVGNAAVSAGSLTVMITAANSPPTGTATISSVTVNEGSLATNTGTYFDANVGDTVTLSSSLGTVIKTSGTSSGGWSWSHTPADGPAGPTVVTIYGNDGTVTVANATFTLTVDNVAPTIAISGATNVNEGSAYSLTLGAVADPGMDTVSSYVVHWGDGNSDTYSSAGVKTHTYADGANVYAVTADLVDEDGTFLDRANALSVTVDNVAPTIAISGNSNVDEGSLYSLTLGDVTDPGDDTVTTYIVHWGDGNTDEYDSNGVVTHTYEDGPASYEITVALVDEDGPFADAANDLSVTVDNVAPTLSVDKSSLSTDDCNTTFSVSGSFSDPGSDSYKIVIDWGDGTTDEYILPDGAIFPMDDGTGAAGTFDITGEHTYSTFGNHEVTVSVQDDDGGADSASLGYALVAATAGVAVPGVLDVHGTDLNDVITVNSNMENGVLVYKVHANSWEAPQTFAAADITLIRIHLCDGDDLASVAGDIYISSAIYGQAGKDHINGGSGSDVLDGGDGDDMVDGGNGNDVVIGGLGNDRLVGGNGHDILIAGAFSSGNEAADYTLLRSQSNAWVAAVGTPGPNASAGENIENTLSSEIEDTDKDSLTGGAGSDLFLIFADDKITDLGTLKKNMPLDGAENKEGDVVQIVGL